MRSFFNKQPSNVIELWDCPSDAKWSLHAAVDNDTKKFNLIPISPSKTLWDFSEKEECDNIIRNWQMTFQASDLRGKQFLDLLDDNFHSIEPSYKNTKKGVHGSNTLDILICCVQEPPEPF